MQQALPAPSRPTTSAHRKVLLAGASGLVGSQILQQLLQDPTVAEVHVLARRDLAISRPKLAVHHVNFRALTDMPSVDEVYLAIGSTIRQAGSQAAFRAVDLGANLAVAQAALAAGATRIGLVSAHGANAHAPLFYARVKGELEDALAALAPATLVIARPSFLRGDRAALHQPPRPGEKIGLWLGTLLSPLLPANYRPIEARQVAQALLATVPSVRGHRVLQYADMQQLHTVARQITA